MINESRMIAVFITCIFTSGCTSHLVNWTMQDVVWFSCLVLLLTGCMLYAANRITLQKAGSPYAGVGPFLCLLGLFLLVFGSKLELLNAFGSDVPFWDPWGLEGQLFPVVLEGRLDPSLLFKAYGEHNPLLERLLAVTILKFNGQWDPIVEMVVGSMLYSLVITGSCLVLWRLAGKKNLPLFCVMIAISGVLHFGWENTVTAFHGFYFLLAFTLLSIVLLICSRPFTLPWFLGLVAALLGQFSAGSGFLAPFVVACVLLFDCISGAQKLKESAPAIVALVAAAVLEFIIVPTQHQHLGFGTIGLVAVLANVIGFLKLFAKAAAWPFGSWVFAPLVWFPFLILILNQLRTKRTSQFQQFLLALGIWTLINAAGMALARGSFAPRYKDVMILGVWVNLIIMFYYLRARVPLLNDYSSYCRLIVAGMGILIICTEASVLHLDTADIWTQYYKEIEEVNTARYILTGDPSSIVNQPEYHVPIPRIFAGGLMAVLENPTLLKILPACIREPLPLEAAENSGFAPGGTPPGVPVLTHRTVLGSWSADKGPSGSEYLSRPISTNFRWLVFDVAGGGQGISFEIVPTEGRAKSISVGEQTAMWKKVMVKAPKVPFRLHVTDRSENGYIAFSLPRELSAGGHFIRRILSGNLYFIVFGMVSLFGGLVALSREELLLHDSDNHIFPQVS